MEKFAKNILQSVVKYVNDWKYWDEVAVATLSTQIRVHVEPSAVKRNRPAHSPNDAEFLPLSEEFLHKKPLFPFVSKLAKTFIPMYFAETYVK
jgi:hypothetical protein